MKTAINFISKNMVQASVLMALFLLPWINIVHFSTFIFIAIALVLVMDKSTYRINFSAFARSPLFLLFTSYFLLQVIAYIYFPERINKLAIEQKISFLIMPVLFFILSKTRKNSWNMAKYGFIAGNVLACLVCLFAALFHYLHTNNIQLFFYHSFSHGIGQGAVYFSLYLGVSLFYSLLLAFEKKYENQAKKFYLFSFISIFLFLNILLLSSKLLIISVSILSGALLLKQHAFDLKLKLAFCLAFALLTLSVLFTDNPVSERYKAIKWDTYSASLANTNFKDFPFDGLNFRLLLLRVGLEIISEKNSFFTGNGGKHYHNILNEKIIDYGLYTGNGKNDSGYLNYNLHNQYMESLVQFGIFGLLIIASIILSSIFYAAKSGNRIFLFIILLFGIAFFTESVLETQAGILLTTIFISGEWIASLQQQKQ